MGSGWSEETPPATGSAATHGGAKAAEVKQLDHGLEDILKDADSAVDRSSMDKLHDQLHAGIFLNKRTKKFWLDEKSKSNCFVLFPKALEITWGTDSRYWKWLPLDDSSNTTIEGIELLNVCWLEIHGKIKACELSPGTDYQAAFVVKIKDPAYGWDVPVNIRLKKPDVSKHERKENLDERPRGRWFEIPIGNFRVQDRDDGGEIEFSMYEYDGGQWKKGLLLKGVIIRTKGSV